MSEQEMVCPKCRGTMRSYERSGVTIEQCGDCRGIFLDRGELERLADAESLHYRNEAVAAAAPPPPPPPSAGSGTSDIVKAVVKAAASGSSGKKGSKGFLSQLLN